MILCEYRFERFNARGDDDYIDKFALRLNELFGDGWTAPEVNRDSAGDGWWEVVLFRDRTTESQATSSQP